MLTVGIRELRQRASELLRQVERGETIQITDRGRPVALLSPLPPGNVYQQLVAEGELVRANNDELDWPEPLPLVTGVESASAALERLRADER
jgi:prevent-host-death family protein